VLATIVALLGLGPREVHAGLSHQRVTQLAQVFEGSAAEGRRSGAVEKAIERDRVVIPSAAERRRSGSQHKCAGACGSRKTTYVRHSGTRATRTQHNDRLAVPSGNANFRPGFLGALGSLGSH
jgi:hypothetical protein